MIYEFFIIFSKRADAVDISNTLIQLGNLVTSCSGLILRTQDLGHRYTAFKVIKPNVGTFWYGRCYYLSVSANPKLITDANKLLSTQSTILRHKIMKMMYKTNLMTNVYARLYE